MPDAPGQYGGIVRRLITTTVDGVVKPVPAGTVLTAEQIMKWSPATRRAMLSTGKVEFYSPPAPTGMQLVTVDKSMSDEQLDPALGQYGGVVLTSLNTGGVEYPAGVRLTADLVMSWPVKNRHALMNMKKVAYFSEAPTPEVEAAIAATDAQIAQDTLLG